MGGGGQEEVLLLILGSALLGEPELVQTGVTQFHLKCLKSGAGELKSRPGTIELVSFAEGSKAMPGTDSPKRAWLSKNRFVRQ